MSTKPIVMGGHLGWSNTRAGVEIFARQEDGGSGRWGTRARYTPGDKGGNDHGDLLTDHLENAGAYEGQAVIVVVLPGRSLDVLQGLTDRIETVLGSAVEDR